MLSLTQAANLNKEWRDAHRLLGARQAIEQELSERSLREGRAGGYRLEDVLERLLQRAGVAGHLTPGQFRAVIDDLVQSELEQERFVSLPAAAAADLLETHQGQRLAFLADYHLSAGAVASLLKYHGLYGCLERGLTTADLESESLQGTLFDQARDRFSLPPNDWLHVGNEQTATRLLLRRACSMIHCANPTNSGATSTPVRIISRERGSVMLEAAVASAIRLSREG